MEQFEVYIFMMQHSALYQRWKTKLCKRHEVAPTAFDIILFLHNNPQYNTAKEICQLRGIKSGIVSVEVERLVQSGWMMRKPDPDDRRKQRLYLTELTDSVATEGKKMQQKYKEVLLKGLSEEEIKQYFSLLQTVIGNLSQAEKEEVSFE